MTATYDLKQIRKALENIDIIDKIEAGFIAYSKGEVVVPPVGEMLFKNPPGEAHIKYGYIRNDDYYVIKIASGFAENPRQGLKANNGLMLLFSQKTGRLDCILLDEGWLTAVRTAAAGAVVAKYMAPKNVNRIGIFGAGEQGRLQLEYLQHILECRDVMVWGLDQAECDIYKRAVELLGFNVQTSLQADEVTASCNFIVTATPAKSPLVRADLVREGTHITAMGSDTPEKQELEAAVLQKAEVVAADSLSQSKKRGEIFQALEAGKITEDKVVELGDLIISPDLGRKTDDQITVADLTGVAVQDYQIAKAVYEGLISSDQ